jgi:hypothetical protein
MIKVNPFTLDILKTHKAFFLLDNLPKFSAEIDVWIKTPTGLESVDFIDVFQMQDGSILAAWKHPYQKLANHNLVAFCNGQTQILNLNNAERMVRYFDKPVDSSIGTFNFSPSVTIPNGDWRCDNSLYGPFVFAGENVPTFVDDLNSVLIVYECFLNVNSKAHITYIEATNRQKLANEKLNNSIVPIVGRTLQEVLRLVYEWSLLANEPFNATDDAAIAAKSFLTELAFTEQELQVLADLPQMQIGQFISGSDNARKRPDNIEPLNAEVENILWRRMASSSLSFIIARNPQIWDLNSVVKIEQEELENGIVRFREYYGIPDYVSLKEEDKVVEFGNIYRPKEEAYIKNQLNGFENKQSIINKAIWIYNH